MSAAIRSARRDRAGVERVLRRVFAVAGVAGLALTAWVIAVLWAGSGLAAAGAHGLATRVEASPAPALPSLSRG